VGGEGGRGPCVRCSGQSPFSAHMAAPLSLKNSLLCGWGSPFGRGLHGNRVLCLVSKGRYLNSALEGLPLTTLVIGRGGDVGEEHLGLGQPWRGKKRQETGGHDRRRPRTKWEGSGEGGPLEGGRRGGGACGARVGKEEPRGERGAAGDGGVGLPRAAAGGFARSLDLNLLWGEGWYDRMCERRICLPLAMTKQRVYYTLQKRHINKNIAAS
jgi:hypothetical protein